MINIPDTPTESSIEIPTPLLLIGSCLIAVGIIIATYVASQVLQVYQAVDSNSFINYLVQTLSGSELVSVSGQAITLGEGSALTTAITLFALLAWTGISLSISLIKSGAHIVSPAYRAELLKLKLRLNQIANKTD